MHFGLLQQELKPLDKLGVTTDKELEGAGECHVILLSHSVFWGPDIMCPFLLSAQSGILTEFICLGNPIILHTPSCSMNPPDDFSLDREMLPFNSKREVTVLV